MPSYRTRVLLLLATLLLPLTGSAAQQESQVFIDSARQEQFADQAATIRQQMNSGGRFSYVSAAERQDIERQLDIITQLLAKRAGGRLSDNEQLDLLAAQETANAILTQRDGKRLICEYTAPTGSNRKVKQCITYADRVNAHTETRRMMFGNLRKTPADSCYDPLKC